jgi:hypothetical protein
VHLASAISVFIKLVFPVHPANLSGLILLGLKKLRAVNTDVTIMTFREVNNTIQPPDKFLYSNAISILCFIVLFLTKSCKDRSDYSLYINKY